MNQISIQNLFSSLTGDAPQLLETHISWVLLAGNTAWKIKKPVNFGFVDFSSLEKRHFYCEEELRLNSRLAPDMYLEVIPVCGTPETPRLGGEDESLDYAVKMRRFDQSGLLSNRLDALTSELMEQLAEQVVSFQQQIQVCGDACEYATPELVLAPMLDNFDTIRRLEPPQEVTQQLEQLEAWTRANWKVLTPLLKARKRSGFIREGHGDMHLGNITLIDGQPVIFDGIEFNPGLRWIDIMNEVAFLLMDLREKQRPQLAWHFLNRYLQQSGDYAGLVLCRYRAMVRAKVAALGDHQSGELRAYLQQALAGTKKPQLRLFITYGLSGSGKSYIASRMADALGMVHIRSDVERKRLAGLSALSRTESSTGSGLYTRDKTALTYQHLLQLAGQILQHGYAVIVDATFLLHEQREMFQKLADRCGIPFTILELSAPEALLRQRIKQRRLQANDPSEADTSVLQLQLHNRQPLSIHEADYAITITPDQGLDTVIQGLSAV